MADHHGHVKRAVALPQYIWDEIANRARAFEGSHDAVIREALHTYFDLVSAMETARIMREEDAAD